LYPVLEAFKPALASIDLRCVAVSPPSEEYWQNLVTSIFLSDRTVDEVKSEQKAIPKLRDTRNNSFEIFCDAVPFDYSVFEKIGKGELKIPVVPIGGNRIRFRKSDLSKLKFTSSQDKIDGSYTRMLRTTDLGSEEERKELWAVVDEQSRLATRHNFKSIPQMIKDCLKIEYSNKHLKDIDIAISPPATIENLRFKDNTLEVILKKTSKLNDLQLNLRLDREGNNIWRESREIPFEKTEFRDNPEVIEIQKALPFDYVNVTLIHRDSGLTLDEGFRKVPIINVGEPFLRTLNSFCSIDEFEKMLFKPEYGGKRPQDIFEDAVAWLLSLAGFDVIRLRLGKKKFEKLRIGEEYDKGGADIIAYEESKRILLIECTTGPADEIKVQRMVETKKYFREKLKGYGKLPIVPILFSPRDIRKSSPSPDVMIADQTVIRRIFEAVVQGNREKARRNLYYSGY
jgi:hypothetical protein